MAQEPMLKPVAATTPMGEKATDTDVMGALRQRRGGAPQREMTSLDILRQGMAEDLPEPGQMERFLTEVAQGAQAGALGLVQVGNTVFLVSKFDESGRPLPPATATVHLVTVEPMSALGARLAVLPNAMRELGYRKLITILEDASMVRVIQNVAPQAKAQVNIQQSAIGGQPVYRAEIDLL